MKSCQFKNISESAEMISLANTEILKNIIIEQRHFYPGSIFTSNSVEDSDSIKQDTEPGMLLTSTP